MVELSEIVDGTDTEFPLGYNSPHILKFISAHSSKEEFEKIFGNFGGKPIKILGINNIRHKTLLGTDFFHTCSFCDKAEARNYETLNPLSEYYRRGYVLLVGNIPIGHIKLKGDRTFLGWRSVMNDSNEIPIIFGGMYSIPYDLLLKLNNHGTLPKKEWAI